VIWWWIYECVVGSSCRRIKFKSSLVTAPSRLRLSEECKVFGPAMCLFLSFFGSFVLLFHRIAAICNHQDSNPFTLANGIEQDQDTV